MDVQGLYRIRLISAVDIDVFLLIVNEEHIFTYGLNVLDLIILDPVNVCRRFVIRMEVLEAPNVLQVLLSHQFIGVLSCLLNL